MYLKLILLFPSCVVGFLFIYWSCPKGFTEFSFFLPVTINEHVLEWYFHMSPSQGAQIENDINRYPKYSNMHMIFQISVLDNRNRLLLIWGLLLCNWTRVGWSLFFSVFYFGTPLLHSPFLAIIVCKSKTKETQHDISNFHMDIKVYERANRDPCNSGISVS